MKYNILISSLTDLHQPHSGQQQPLKKLLYISNEIWNEIWFILKWSFTSHMLYNLLPGLVYK